MLKKTLSKLWAPKSPASDERTNQRKAIRQALRPHLSKQESDLWWNEWDKVLSTKPEAAKAPFLLITRFTNKICATHRLTRTAQKKIRTSLLKSLMPRGSDH
ncbi:MAG: hypothetical protein OES09_01330 [Gammaproteobacteria bacterium]|nr:hypothetical protein [Gammaproteobacteria bacterium]